MYMMIPRFSIKSLGCKSNEPAENGTSSCRPNLTTLRFMLASLLDFIQLSSSAINKVSYWMPGNPILVVLDFDLNEYRNQKAHIVGSRRIAKRSNLDLHGSASFRLPNMYAFTKPSRIRTMY
jgi:hypothetical protein